MTDSFIDIRRINLNLIPVLLTILRTRNITQAAKFLHLSQSATSGCLKRLRLAFDDELLIPSGRELVLTEKAKILLPQLEELLAKAAALVNAPVFDPASDGTRVKVATADWIGALLIPGMSQHMSQFAPNMSVEFIQSSLLSMIDDVKRGFVDVLIGPKEMLEWCNLGANAEHPDFCFEHCFVDELVAIESTITPCPGAETCLETYLNHPHIAFYFQPQMHVSVEQTTLSKLGLSQCDRFLVPHFTALPYLVATTGAIAVVPSSLAERFESAFPIRVFKPPLDFPPISLIMLWSKARNGDQALKWLRTLISDSFALASFAKGKPTVDE